MDGELVVLSSHLIIITIIGVERGDGACVTVLRSGGGRRGVGGGARPDRGAAGGSAVDDRGRGRSCFAAPTSTAGRCHADRPGPQPCPHTGSVSTNRRLYPHGGGAERGPLTPRVAWSSPGPDRPRPRRPPGSWPDVPHRALGRLGRGSGLCRPLGGNSCSAPASRPSARADLVPDACPALSRGFAKLAPPDGCAAIGRRSGPFRAPAR